MGKFNEFREVNILQLTMEEDFQHADLLIQAMPDRELRALHIAIMRIDLAIEVEKDKRKGLLG